ncbi:MAG TPA: hypothetical protein VLW85_16335 [Myxococcales bacterium]|nr:hypothetical protein [Myxococcales bacterium]
MQILIAALLALAPQNQPEAAAAPPTTEQQGTTAAIPNDNASGDVSQTTPSPSGQSPGGGVASGPNEQNALNGQPQEQSETRAQPKKHGQGKSAKSRMHQPPEAPAGPSADAPMKDQAGSVARPSGAATKPTDTREPVDNSNPDHKEKP